MTTKSKEHLIDELQAYYNQRGEVPGRRRFEKDTGITQGQYLKHWPRWSDFVDAAGLHRNSPLPKSDKEALLGRLAEVTRRLKKFPTAPELRIQRQNDKSVPSDDTLRKLIGDNKELRNALYKFCQKQPAYSDVAEYILVSDDERLQDQDASALLEGEVYLFLMRIEKGKRYKIGRSVNLDVRQNRLAAELPENLERLHTIRTDDAVGIEAYWHKRFSSKRRNGEWFALSDGDVKAFKKRGFQ